MRLVATLAACVISALVGGCSVVAAPSPPPGRQLPGGQVVPDRLASRWDDASNIVFQLCVPAGTDPQRPVTSQVRLTANRGSVHTGRARLVGRTAAGDHVYEDEGTVQRELAYVVAGAGVYEPRYVFTVPRSIPHVGWTPWIRPLVFTRDDGVAHVLSAKLNALGVVAATPLGPSPSMRFRLMSASSYRELGVRETLDEIAGRCPDLQPAIVPLDEAELRTPG